MSNRFDSVLNHWSALKDAHQWVLATIIGTDGSSYRKTGARMMINDLGQHFGLLSGGCLESDIMLQARRCWENGKNRIVEYDTREEEDLSWRLGLGCGGRVQILLQPASRENEYLQLDLVHQSLSEGEVVVYWQALHEAEPENRVMLEGAPVDNPGNQGFTRRIKPAPRLAVFGGGVDARPLVSMAAELGWHIRLLDSRTGYARPTNFPRASHITHVAFEGLTAESWLNRIDAAVVMTHNLNLDAQAIRLCQSSSVQYLGLLGPAHRTKEVLTRAGLTFADLPVPLASPIGLGLGGELPESIALSILAEAHACLEGASAQSISGRLEQNSKGTAAASKRRRA